MFQKALGTKNVMGLSKSTTSDSSLTDWKRRLQEKGKRKLGLKEHVSDDVTNDEHIEHQLALALQYVQPMEEAKSEISAHIKHLSTFHASCARLVTKRWTFVTNEKRSSTSSASSFSEDDPPPAPEPETHPPLAGSLVIFAKPQSQLVSSNCMMQSCVFLCDQALAVCTILFEKSKSREDLLLDYGHNLSKLQDLERKLAANPNADNTDQQLRKEKLAMSTEEVTSINSEIDYLCQTLVDSKSDILNHINCGIFAAHKIFANSLVYSLTETELNYTPAGQELFDECWSMFHDPDEIISNRSQGFVKQNLVLSDLIAKAEGDASARQQRVEGHKVRSLAAHEERDKLKQNKLDQQAAQKRAEAVAREKNRLEQLAQQEETKRAYEEQMKEQQRAQYGAQMEQQKQMAAQQQRMQQQQYNRPPPPRAPPPQQYSQAQQAPPPTYAPQPPQVPQTAVVAVAVAVAAVSMADDEIFETVEEWLKALKLEEYLGRFYEEGFDDLDAVKELEQEDLGSLGVTKKGHLKKLEKAIVKLKEVRQSVAF